MHAGHAPDPDVGQESCQDPGLHLLDLMGLVAIAEEDWELAAAKPVAVEVEGEKRAQQGLYACWAPRHPRRGRRRWWRGEGGARLDPRPGGGPPERGAREAR